MSRTLDRKALQWVLAVGVAAVAAPVLAHSSLAMLDTLERGAWEIRYRDGSGVGKVCLRSGRELIQLRHAAAGCSRIVVSDQPGEIAVQYTCKGTGYGRTEIRRETGELVQILSQGVAAGRPFQIDAEARRVGRCAR